MKDNIDLLILNNCPAFYKINLYNEIAKQRSIFVVFIGYYDQVVIETDFKKNINFPYIILNETQIGKRNIFSSFLKLRKVMKNIIFKKIIYGGYIEPEFIATSFLISKEKNILQTESAGETKLLGLKYYIKKILLKRYSKALASGSMHELMLRRMEYHDPVIITKGVGIINKGQGDRQPYVNDDRPLKFLYVGRLIELKNIRNVISVFNDAGLALTIAGTGILENELKAMSKSNITFTGFVENKELNSIYKNHDVFILASFSEPWGLVVEEALYRGCALILSDRVGCLEELLVTPNTGTFFNPEDTESMREAIRTVIENYNLYKDNADHFDLDGKDRQQVQAYTETIFLK